MAKAKYPVRRSQLIAPFGVGSMLVVKGGASLVCGGLDFWFKRENLNEKGVDENEFKIEEYRLEELLRVNHFRLPPDFREVKPGLDTPNTDLAIPFLRFPNWHVCPRCERMEFFPLNQQIKPFCFDCNNSERKRITMTQMPFVAMCEDGHLQDVPWREFVHRAFKPDCDGKLKYLSSGGAVLAAQKIKCDKCGNERSLGGITFADATGETNLSKYLAPKEGEYLCRGQRPWLGTNDGEICNRHLRVNLRGAGNVWFAQVFSSIYVPQKTAACPADLLSFLRRADILPQIQFFAEQNTALLPTLRVVQNFALAAYTDEQIEAGLEIVLQQQVQSKPAATINEATETAFRRVEYEVLRQEQNEELLVTRSVALDKYDSALQKMFARIMLIHKLRETRVFAGFTRVYAENSQKLDERKKMLRRESSFEADKNWLPASLVFGEGLFFELDEQLLQRWERDFSEPLARHLQPLANSHGQLVKQRGSQNQAPAARFVLLHTLSHLLINRLTFECGYTSAALRERLYVSTKPDAPMAGLLIYTADGDSDGTLGGLVRMGQPGKLESVLFNALDHARWCSSDPVCSEMGAHGQGPDSCNLAACHSCALVPETSCENFNRFLDRQMLVNGFSAGMTAGFFDFVQNA